MNGRKKKSWKKNKKKKMKDADMRKKGKNKNICKNKVFNYYIISILNMYVFLILIYI